MSLNLGRKYFEEIAKEQYYLHAPLTLDVQSKHLTAKLSFSPPLLLITYTLLRRLSWLWGIVFIHSMNFNEVGSLLLDEEVWGVSWHSSSFQKCSVGLRSELEFFHSPVLEKVSVKGNCKAVEYKDFPFSCVVPALWEQVSEWYMVSLLGPLTLKCLAV